MAMAATCLKRNQEKQRVSQKHIDLQTGKSPSSRVDRVIRFMYQSDGILGFFRFANPATAFRIARLPLEFGCKNFRDFLCLDVQVAREMLAFAMAFAVDVE
jgi:hypothetical protein